MDESLVAGHANSKSDSANHPSEGANAHDGCAGAIGCVVGAIRCRHEESARLDYGGEIAFVLGFEELNSFTRAFQSWEGTTPNRWRSARLLAATQSAVQ